MPVKDLTKATEFYEKLGFKKNPMFGNDNASCVSWSDEIVVMLLAEEFFQRFIPGRRIAAEDVTEALLCLGMESREAVDDFAGKALANGGKLLENEVASGYGDAVYDKDVEDLDGHIWELLYMDMSK